MQQITDAFGSFTAPAADYFRQLVSGFAITASLVCDESGNTISSQGSSSGLGNDTDLALLVAMRRQPQVIVTSGKTLRADNYRFPRFADLAVLTSHKVDIDAPEGQKLILSSSSYVQMINDLSRSGYARMHVEYGVTGIKELIAKNVLDALLLSSRRLSGVEALSRELKVSPIIIQLDDLYVGLVAWHSDRASS